MINHYSIATLALGLLFAQNSSAQNVKPQPSATELKSQAQQTFGLANQNFEFRGGGGNTCASANPLTVGASCNPATFDASTATQELAPILCNGFTSTTANDLWFSFQAISATSTVTVTGLGNYDAVLQYYSGNCGTLNPLGCMDNTFPPNSTVETVAIPTAIGQTYFVRVYYYTTPLPTNFQFTICVTGQGGGGPTPPNDLCTGAVPQNLNVGNTVTFTGNNTGATVLAGTPFVVVWEAITLSTCATVTVNYCVPGSVFEDFLVNLATQCPDVLTGLLTGTVANNCTVTFTELPAGTYYIPVLVDAALTPVGNYTISASAVACPVGYCSAGATNVDPLFEKISNVAFAGINNPSTSPAGYENFTAIVGNVTQGSSNGITVTISNGFDDDQVLVWIDFDQSESFGPAELVYTSPLGVGPHAGTIAIPGTASLGQTRMRIRLHDSALGPNVTPCGTSTYGQVEDYTINISSGGGSTPPNDLCANATSITVGATCVGTAGTVGNATQSVAGALCSGFTATVANDVWYTFIANTASTTVQVTGAGDATTGLDPVLEVFSGTCSALTSLGCVDATTRGGTETLVVTTTPGATYFYRIYQWPYAAPQTVFGITTCVFSVGGSVAPVNDLCANATSISVGASCVGTAGTVENATQALAGALCSGFTATVANDVWYTFTATSASTTVQVTGSGDATTGVDPILEVYSGTCAALTSLACVDATVRGGTETLVVPTTIGTTYYYRIYHWPYATPETIFGFTTCVFNSAPTPPNDLCTGAVPQNLNVGNTVTFTGNNTGATVLAGTTFVVVWEAITLSTCATVTVNYCVPGSVFEDFLVNLATQCPDVLTGLLTGTVANDCTVTFTELPAGTYYIPVLVDAALTPVGNYTITASAVACPVGYCSAGATNVDPLFEKISNVAFGDINNPSTLPAGYEDFTAIATNVTQGSSNGITVTISNGFADDQVLVWIDFDQSDSFEPAELVYTSPLGVGPHSGTIAIPMNATLGQTRMRIRLHDSELGPNVTPCGTSTYGQVEDYTVNIDISTGLSDAGSLQLGVFPNPSNGDLFVRHNIDGPAQLEVFDITGQVVYSAQRSLVSGEVAQLPLAGKLAAGTYILRVTGENIRGEQRVVVY